MRYLFICKLIGICSITSCFAQPTAFRWREELTDKYIGINVSTSRYNGDLSERYNFSHLELGWAIEGHARYRFKEQWCVSGQVGAYHIRADQQYTRNKANYLSFASTNFVATVGLQWDVRDIDYNQLNIPYVLAGAGITNLAPTTVLKGITYSLPAFKTEGVAYARWVGQIHYGLGMPVTLTPATQLRIEGRYTHVFSDYLDDVSAQYVDKATASIIEQSLADRRIAEGLPSNSVGATRGNGSKNDGYFLFTLQLIGKFR
ncbi:outer membrane beta-barrel protein [uncultured Fibrella sp.]|uniref:outer membrane beta-barrel protein n=1 Tax=uncultured Fibrella sp. TaxID=1284596 RepID=UPI0035CB39BB